MEFIRSAWGILRLIVEKNPLSLLISTCINATSGCERLSLRLRMIKKDIYDNEITRVTNIALRQMNEFEKLLWPIHEASRKLL